MTTRLPPSTRIRIVLSGPPTGSSVQETTLGDLYSMDAWDMDG